MKSNIIAQGEASVKTHVSNGSKTGCNKKSLNSIGTESFIWDYKNCPQICCTQCISFLKRTGKIK